MNQNVMTSRGVLASTFVCPCLREIFILYINIIHFLNIKNIMDKKELKFYEAPACEVVELNVNAQLLAGSTNPDNPLDDSTADTEEME